MSARHPPAAAGEAGSSPPCAACGATTIRFDFVKNGAGIWTCARCEHRFTPVVDGVSHVSNVYADTYFTAGGAGYPDYLAGGPLLRAHGARYGEILKRYRPSGRVLDVGSAAGFILGGLLDAGWTGSGVEPNARMVAHARETLGLDVAHGTLEDLTIEEQFDAVTMIQVIGHFYDLPRAMQAAARATRPGGLLLIEAWNRGSLFARLLGSAWPEYSPPSVVHWFTRKSLERLASDHGFRPLAHGRPRKYVGLGHVKSMAAHALGPAARLLPLGRLPGHLVVTYPPVDLFWSIFVKTDAAVSGGRGPGGDDRVALETRPPPL